MSIQPTTLWKSEATIQRIEFGKSRPTTICGRAVFEVIAEGSMYTGAVVFWVAAYQTFGLSTIVYGYLAAMGVAAGVLLATEGPKPISSNDEKQLEIVDLSNRIITNTTKRRHSF